jgi:hypothetical protein
VDEPDNAAPLGDGHQPGADVDLGDDSRLPARVGERGKRESSDGGHERKACLHVSSFPRGFTDGQERRLADSLRLTAKPPKGAAARELPASLDGLAVPPSGGGDLPDRRRNFTS